MEVNKYIAQLLYKFDCVILPDFGGFVANYKAASIDYVNHNFYPPRKEILFNKNLDKNDGLLINHISQLERIEYIKSKNIVVGFVNETIKKLNNGEKVVFDGIGVFYYDKHKNLQFEPNTSQNFLLQSYGLSSFHFPALENEKDTGLKQKTIYLHKNEDLSIRRKNIRRIVVAASIVLALSIVNTNRNNFNNQSGINPFSGFGTTDNQNYTVSKDVKANSDNDYIVSAKEVKEKTLIKNNEKADKTTELAKVKNTAVKKYYLIAGSFSDDYNAKKFTKELIQLGYNALMLKPDRGRFRVAFATYINKSDALRELKKIRATKASSAWLLAKKD